MKRIFYVLLSLLLLYESRGEGQCATASKPAGGVSAPDNVWISSDGSMQNSTDPNAASKAAGMWTAGCPSMGFPRPVTTRPASGNYGTITLKYVTGYNPKNDIACGGFLGTPGGTTATIFIYQFAHSPSGAQYTCADAPGGIAQLVAHEIGHYYALNNSSCDTEIMSDVNNLAHSVHADECLLANQVNLTDTERNGGGGGGGGGGCGGSVVAGGDDSFSVRFSFSAIRPMLRCSCVECPEEPCCGGSPILIDLDGGGFRLTGANSPVRFDVNANGRPEATGWTEAASETAFLVLDRNSDNCIADGRELFGNYTPMPDGSKAANGYVALAVYDEPSEGGNGDGRISAEDAIYSQLQLWIDYNHNGKNDPGELISLEAAGVESIDLRYREEKRVDKWGNAFRYRSSATLINERGRRRKVETYDVYFVRVQGQ